MEHNENEEREVWCLAEKGNFRVRRCAGGGWRWAQSKKLLSGLLQDKLKEEVFFRMKSL